MAADISRCHAFPAKWQSFCAETKRDGGVPCVAVGFFWVGGGGGGGGEFFPFVVSKVRDTAAQKLNQGRLNLALAPLQLLPFDQEPPGSCFRPTNEKTHQKTRQLHRLVAASGSVAQCRLYSQATNHQNKVSDINIFFNCVILASSRGFSS